MHNILQKIIEKKMDNLLNDRILVSEEDIAKIAKTISDKHVFYEAIEKSKKKPALIAEIKLASPSKLFFDSPKDVVRRVVSYETSGVDAISVVVEKHFFKGDPVFVSQIKKKVKKPVLMKDFVIDSYQLYQAKQVGADAVLLIAKIVTKERLSQLVRQALLIGLEPVVEINDREDLRKALYTRTAIIAVNARDLVTFAVDVDAACDVLREVPKEYMRFGFSGVQSGVEIEKYREAGADGVLVGTALMETKDIGRFIEELYD